MQSSSGEQTLVRFRPSQDSGVALLTEVALVLSYLALERSTEGTPSMMLVLGLIIPLVTVAVPLLWTTVIRDEPLSELGITTKRIVPSLLLALLLVNVQILPITSAKPQLVAALWVPQALVGALSLWEVFFVFGWLQGRFEHDFGVLPAVLGAAACYALYQVAFGSMELVISQFMLGVLFAVAFRTVNNLLVLWPLVWAASAARLCILEGYCQAGWGTAVFSAIVLAIELVLIALLGLRQQSASRRRAETFY